MKLELKLISLIFCLGLFSLPVKSDICPGVMCTPNGPCVPSQSDCPSKIVKLQGKPEYIYRLSPGTSYYCENGQFPQSSGTGVSAYFVCFSESSSLTAVTRQTTHFKLPADVAYALGENTAVQCKGEPTQKGNLWTCPSKAAQ